MTRTIHMGVCVRGVLRNHSLREWVNSITHNGKLLTTKDEVFDFFCDHLAQGHEVLPVTECDNWDWKDGCMGHEKQSEKQGEKHWAVTVSLDWENLITIESAYLSGKSDLSHEEKDVIRRAAQHLLAFVGESNEDGWTDPAHDQIKANGERVDEQS